MPGVDVQDAIKQATNDHVAAAPGCNGSVDWSVASSSKQCNPEGHAAADVKPIAADDGKLDITA